MAGGSRVPKRFSPDYVRSRNTDDDFLAVIDGFVVDATNYGNEHPGGMRKFLSTNHAKIGATGQEFGFSFGRGSNAHYPQTNKTFKEGCKRFMRGEGTGTDYDDSDEGKFLPPMTVTFPDKGGSIRIIGILDEGMRNQEF